METMDEFNLIFEADLPEVEKLTRAFDLVTGRYLEAARKEIELLKAMGDGEALVKEQIKMSTLEHARGIYADCYQRATGRSAWDE
jgi:hypothetical protein